MVSEYLKTRIFGFTFGAGAGTGATCGAGGVGGVTWAAIVPARTIIAI
jgi:hypothetical protein